MNVLWDFRLFSYGYRDRGIGKYTALAAGAILKLQSQINFFAWGERRFAPPGLADAPITWIDYEGGGWKSSVWQVPLLARRFRIDLIHYWAALGPLTRIGIAPLTGTKTVATIYDLGVELWDTPHGRHVRSTAYWRFQKCFFNRINGILAISNATLGDLRRIFPAHRADFDFMLPQFPLSSFTEGRRQPFFLTLGGAAHKNCRRVVEAFAAIKLRHPEYRLLILGAIDEVAEELETLPEGVTVEPDMSRYGETLDHAAGLVYCSLHEGLGLPPLEALHTGCPVILADIAPLRETCSEAGCFVDPLSITAIADGMERLIADNETWVERSCRGAAAYRQLSADAPLRCLGLYGKLTNTSIGYGGTSPYIHRERRQ